MLHNLRRWGFTWSWRIWLRTLKLASGVQKTPVLRAHPLRSWADISVWVDVGLGCE